MLIALDYDDTYTQDPPLWRNFIRMVERAGHEIVCVTMRFPTSPVEMPIKVYYTSWRAKQPFMKAAGLDVDVWIDDSPHWVIMDAKLPEPGEELEAN